MTPDELLNRIKEGQRVDRQEMMLRSNALRAVVELHKPMPSQFAEGFISCFECSTMDYDVYWDKCPTIQAIEKELA